MKDHKAAVKRAFVELSGGQVHYRTAGKGPALLLLPMTTASSAMYLDIMPLLAPPYTVIAMDTPGLGDSDPPPEGFRIEDLGQVVVQLLDALGLDRVSLLGHHTGGIIAAELAVAHPQRVEKLVLSACSDRSEEERIQMREQLGPLSLRSDGTHLLEVWRERQNLATSLTPVPVLHKIALMRLQGMDTAYKVFLAATHHYLSERLPLVRAPTLLVAGEHDPLAKYMEQHRSLLSQSPLVATAVIKGAGAYVTLEKPQEYAHVVRQFLDKPASR